MVVDSLWSNLETQHNVYTLFTLPVDTFPPVATRHLASIYNVEEGKCRCLVPGCLQGEEELG